MTVLAICRPSPDADPAATAALLPREIEVMRRLRAEKSLTQAWIPTGPGAVLLLDLDAGEAATVTAQLPLAVAGQITIELIEIRPVDLGGATGP